MSLQEIKRPDTYFNQASSSRRVVPFEEALLRCINRLKSTMPVIGLRNPKIGLFDNTWDYCDPYDWVIGFQAGQLWLAAQLTGAPCFVVAAQARRETFRHLLSHPGKLDHDLGFQFSLSCVAEWKMTGNPEARELAIQAAGALAQRFQPDGGYLKAWNYRPGDPKFSAFSVGRMIADTIQNLSLLYWAYSETGKVSYKEIADQHAYTTLKYLVREDGTTYHTFAFDPYTGEPLRGQTHQGYADESCWSRGQAWLIHGFAQCYLYTQNQHFLEAAIRLAKVALSFMGEEKVPVWDYRLDADQTPWRDSSAGAIMAAGIYIIASVDQPDRREAWIGQADRLLEGLLESCDLTKNPDTFGFLAHGAAHVHSGRYDTMLPYGDYFFMEALMRSQGHTQFFW